MAHFFRDEIEIVLKVASASAMILDEMSGGEFVIQTKESSRDIVTEVDTRVEDEIRTLLKGSPHSIVGEERADTKGTGDYTWYLDPIDGTTNFVSKIPLFSTSIGLASRDSFHVGAVILPAMKELYFVNEQGAYLNAKKLEVGQADLKESLVAGAFSGTVGDPDYRSREHLLFGKINDQSRGCLRLGSASVNLCYAAANRLQACYGIRNKMWDVAGGIAIALAAGCKVYVERFPDTNEINYVVGNENVADVIADLVNGHELGSLKLISNERGLA